MADRPGSRAGSSKALSGGYGTLRQLTFVSPSNTPEPFHGPRFPGMTIRDNVEAVHRLLTEELKVTHLRAIIGFSMGVQQASQWAVSYPTFADRNRLTCGTAKTWPHGIVRLEGQIAAITTDAAFNNGDYTSQPK